MTFLVYLIINGLMVYGLTLSGGEPGSDVNWLSNDRLTANNREQNVSALDAFVIQYRSSIVSACGRTFEGWLGSIKTDTLTSKTSEIDSVIKTLEELRFLVGFFPEFILSNLDIIHGFLRIIATSEGISSEILDEYKKDILVSHKKISCLCP